MIPHNIKFLMTRRIFHDDANCIAWHRLESFNRNLMQFPKFRGLFRPLLKRFSDFIHVNSFHINLQY